MDTTLLKTRSVSVKIFLEKERVKIGKNQF